MRLFLSKITYTLTRNIIWLISMNTLQTLWQSQSNLPTFPTIDLTEKDTLNKYLKRFNSLCKAVGVTNDGHKLSMLLTYIGDEVYEIYKNIISMEEYTLI